MTFGKITRLINNSTCFLRVVEHTRPDVQYEVTLDPDKPV